MTPQELAVRLGVTVKSTKSNGGLMAICPLHADGTASLSLDIGDDGKPLIWCGAGCNTEPLLARLKGAQPAAPKKQIVATYDYVSASGDLLHQTIRYEPKAFSQRRPDGRGGWLWNLQDIEPVLYRLPVLVSANLGDWVHICEGEKDADRLEDLGLIATTAPMGAGKWRPSYSEFLRGRKVAIIPDRDEPGQRHAQQVAKALLGVAAVVRIIPWDVRL